MRREETQEHVAHNDTSIPPEAGFFSWDIPNNIAYADSALAELFGLDSDKTSTGIPIEHYVSRVVKEDQPRLNDAIRKCILGNHPQQEMYRVINRQGQHVTVIGYGRVFMNTSSEPTQYVGLIVPAGSNTNANDNR